MLTVRLSVPLVQPTGKEIPQQHRTASGEIRLSPMCTQRSKGPKEEGCNAEERLLRAATTRLSTTAPLELTLLVSES